MSEEVHEKIDAPDLTDEAILKMLIDRERQSIVKSRKMEALMIQSRAEAKAADQRIMDYIHKYGTDEG